jgi:hypothetical protein
MSDFTDLVARAVSPAMSREEREAGALGLQDGLAGEVAGDQRLDVADRLLDEVGLEQGVRRLSEVWSASPPSSSARDRSASVTQPVTRPPA